MLLWVQHLSPLEGVLKKLDVHCKLDEQMFNVKCNTRKVSNALKKFKQDNCTIEQMRQL